MSRAAVRDNSNAFSLFPFLAVLLCTMGALVVLLVAVTRLSREQAKEEVVRRRSTAVAQVATPTVNRRPQLEQVKQYVARLDQVQTRAEQQLRDDRAHLRDLEDHLQRLQDQAASLGAAAAELAALRHQHHDDREQAQREATRLEKLIDATRESIEELKKEAASRPQSYAIVPYTGPHGTYRPPLYIECRKDAVILQPEGIRLTKDDFRPPLGPGNPLAAALRAARTHYAGQHAESAIGSERDPYPLILVRPDGIMAYYVVRKAIESWDSNFGYEMIDGDWDLKFPPPNPELATAESRAVELARLRMRMLAEAAPRAYGTLDADGRGVFPSTAGALGRVEVAGEPGSGYGYGGPGDGLGLGGDASGDGEDAGGYGLGQSDGLGKSNGLGPGGDGGMGRPAGGGDRLAGDASVGGDGSNGDQAGGLGDGTGSGHGRGTGGPGEAGLQGDGQGTGPAADPGAMAADGGTGDGTAGPGQPGTAGGVGSPSTGSPGGDAGQLAAGTAAGGAGGAPGAAAGGGTAGATAGAMGNGQCSGGTNSSQASSGQSASNTLSMSASDATSQGTDVTASKGANLDPPRGQSGSVPIRRSIHLVVRADHVAILPERSTASGPAFGGKEIQIPGATEASLDEIVKALRSHVEEWGIAGRGLFWRPVLVLDVGPDGWRRAEELERLFKRRGIELRWATTANRDAEIEPHATR